MIDCFIGIVMKINSTFKQNGVTIQESHARCIYLPGYRNMLLMIRLYFRLLLPISECSKILRREDMYLEKCILK